MTPGWRHPLIMPLPAQAVKPVDLPHHSTLVHPWQQASPPSKPRRGIQMSVNFKYFDNNYTRRPCR